MLGAWINWPLPTYIPTLPTSALVVFQKIKSPACKSDLLTALPLLLWAKEVLGIDIPSCLWHHEVKPLQSKVLGPVAPQTYLQPSLLLAKLTNFSPVEFEEELLDELLLDEL